MASTKGLAEGRWVLGRERIPVMLIGGRWGLGSCCTRVLRWNAEWNRKCQAHVLDKDRWITSHTLYIRWHYVEQKRHCPMFFCKIGSERNCLCPMVILITWISTLVRTYPIPPYVCVYIHICIYLTNSIYSYSDVCVCVCVHVLDTWDPVSRTDCLWLRCLSRAQ